MNATALIARQQGFKQNPFDAPVARFGSRTISFGESPTYSSFSRQGSPSQLVTFDPFSVTDLQRFRPEESPMPPALVFTNALQRLSASEPFRISPKLSQRLMELSGLKSGWDGEQATAPRPEAVAHAVGLILFLQAALPEFEEPFVVPTINGFTQLEWHHGKRALEFEATEKGWSVGGAEKKPNGEDVYYETDAERFDVSKLLAAYRWLAGLELLWPII